MKVKNKQKYKLCLIPPKKGKHMTTGTIITNISII